MTEFEKIATTSRIIGLYRERGLERTSDDIRRLAEAIAKRHGISLAKAFDAVEGDLLASNPNPEKWE